MEKKGNVEVQFNWIFILIIGAMILVFFGTLIYKQKNISETKTTHEILSKLDVILSETSSTTKTLKKIEMPNVEITFNYADGTYLVGGQRQELKGRFLFAPSVFSGDFIVAWTRSWNLGFDIVTFVYLTSPTVRYYLVADENEFAVEVNSTIERRSEERSEENLIRMDLITPAQVASLQDKGYDKVRLIFFNQEPKVPSNFVDKGKTEISALKVVEDESDPNHGTVTFYRKTSAGFVADADSTFNYLGREMLYGAIFVDDKLAYDYLFNKAMDKLEILAKIYELKADALIEDVLADPDLASCTYPDEDFANIADAAGKTSRGDDDIRLISGLIPTLSNIHETLLYSSCPLLY